MAEKTAPVVLIDDRDQQWLEGAIKDKLIRHIEFDDINNLQMGVASGGFGMIHAGEWRRVRVAVKVLYNPADFIQEVGNKLCLSQQSQREEDKNGDNAVVGFLLQDRHKRIAKRSLQCDFIQLLCQVTGQDMTFYTYTPLTP